MSEFLTWEHLDGLIQGVYILSGILFIGALAGLSKHETAKTGNIAGMTGMGLALVATLLKAAQNAELDYDDTLNGVGVTLLIVVLAMAVGGSIGAWRARTVEMTGMPELVAILHSFVGLAAVLVGINSFLDPNAPQVGPEATIHDVEVFLGVFIGAVTFTGSIVANLKLSGKMKSDTAGAARPTPAQPADPAGLAGAAVLVHVVRRLDRRPDRSRPAAADDRARPAARASTWSPPSVVATCRWWSRC